MLHNSAQTQMPLPNTNMGVASPAASCPYFSIQVHQINSDTETKYDTMNIYVVHSESAPYIKRASCTKPSLSTKPRLVVT